MSGRDSFAECVEGRADSEPRQFHEVTWAS